jgi:tripartite-type tricarboxylate transporter receptor subunit TctC
VLVPFAPGGAVDTSARVLTQAMTQRLNWQFVIENRPGGNGFIATTAVAKAPADGYTPRWSSTCRPRGVSPVELCRARHV